MRFVLDGLDIGGSNHQLIEELILVLVVARMILVIQIIAHLIRANHILIPLEYGISIHIIRVDAAIRQDIRVCPVDRGGCGWRGGCWCDCCNGACHL